METHNLKEEQIKKFLARPYSWSNHSAFRDYDKELWYAKYILGEKTPENKRMTFGKLVGTRIETDPTYIPQLPRGIMEYGVEVMMDDIALVGYMDAYDPETKTINEYKTSSPAGWSQEKVDEHGQLTLYCLLLLLKEDIKPEDVTIQLHHLHTEESGDFSIKFATPFTIDTYTTKRTTKQCLMFGAEIIKLRKEMEEYIKNHK